MNKTIEKYDRLVVTQEDIELLFEWRDKNKDLVQNFNPVLDNGVIINKSTPLVKYVFQKEGTKYLYTMITEKDGNAIHSMEWNLLTKIGRTMNTILNKEEVQEFNQVLISLHASLMAYMEHYRDNDEHVQSRSHEVTTGYKKQKKSKKKTPIKIRRKTYSFTITEESLNEVTRSYERQIEKWTVRGHWRKTKNGQVWIKPHVKGTGKEVTPKEYKM